MNLALDAIRRIGFLDGIEGKPQADLLEMFNKDNRQDCIELYKTCYKAGQESKPAEKKSAPKGA